MTEQESQTKFSEILAKHEINEKFESDTQYEQYPLNLDLSKKEDLGLMKDLLTIRLPKIQKLEIGYLHQDVLDDVRNLLDASFPNRLESLVFNFSGRPKSKDDLIDLSYFIDLLIEIGSLVSNEIKIWN